MRSIEIKREIDEIRKPEDEIVGTDQKYETSKYIFSFQKFQ